jgi:hypothetical protein
VSTQFEKLVQEAHDEQFQSTLPPAVRDRHQKVRPLVLFNAVLIPVVFLTFLPQLAWALLIFVPALPVIVTVLWLQMRHEWSQPETAVGLCTLTGFAIGYALLFWQNAPWAMAKLHSLLRVAG